MINKNLALAATRQTAELYSKRICKVKAKLAEKIFWDEYHTGKPSHWRKVNLNLFMAYQRLHFVARGNNTGCHFTP